MRKFDEYGLKICRFQGELFAASLTQVSCSSAVFLRRFMLSDIARRMDCDGFRFETVSVSDALSEIEEQYGKSDYGKLKYGSEEMYWMGYIYRCWAYTHEVGSRELYRTVKPAELRKLYLPYHSLDPEQAIERISEEKGLGSLSEDEMLKRGVEIIKRIRMQKTSRVAEKSAPPYKAQSRKS